MADDEWVLLTYTPQTSSSQKRSEAGVKDGLTTAELRDTNSVLPVRLQLGLGQTADISKQHKDQILERILEIERTIFNAEVLTDPERCRQMQEVFLPHAAVLMKLLSGSVIRLMFLRHTDVDRFYHNHYRVGEGSLSQQLSHILISEHLQDKVKGAQLIVRLQVKHEDYLRVRDRLGRGLDRTTSIDNLLALPPPNRQVDHSSLKALDLAVLDREDLSRAEGHVSTPKFRVRQLQAVVRTCREKSERQARQLQELQIKQRQMQTARKDTEAMVHHLSKELTRLTKQNEKAEKILGEHKLESQQLQETNKSMAATVEELLDAKHTAVRIVGEKSHLMEVQLQTMRGQRDTARQTADFMRKEVARVKQEEKMVQKILSEHKEEIQRLQEINRTKELKIETMQEDIKTAREQTEATVFRRVTKETANLRKKLEEAQRSCQKQQEEIHQLQDSNKGMAATIEELTAENTKMSNQLADIPKLHEEVRKWREKDETSQKVLSEHEVEIQQLQETNKSMAATIKELLYEKHISKSQGQGYVRDGEPSEQKDSTSGNSSRLSKPEDTLKVSTKADIRLLESRGSVLLVSDEYSTSKGGISTINLNVARMLTTGGAKVYATVLEASQQDERDAERDGVKLLKPRLDADSSAKPSSEWLTVYHKHHFPHIPSDVCCIVGHVDVTSRAARKIKEERFPHAKLAMFGHVAPEETEHYKSDEKALGVGRKEASIQDDIGKADVVFSVGPRIHRHYGRFLRRNYVDHHIFLPEPSKVFSEANVIFENEDEVEKPERVVLSIGRVRNVEMLKGHDLAAGAIDKAAQRLHNQYTLRLRVRGIDENDFKDSKRILEEKLRSGRVKLTLLPYGSQEEIRRDMEACHLVLMPSRAEPFGLVGLEAIAAGVPVLISEQSGLAELVEQLAKKYQPKFRHCIVTMTGDTATDADVEMWAYRIEDVLKNARSEFAEARAFREKLLASKYREESHQKFLQACGITATPSAQAESGDAEADDSN